MRDVTWLGNGRPVEEDHFQADGDGGVVLKGHSTWLYDGEKRQQYVISQFEGMARRVERNVYDSKGRPYFVDQTDYWPGHTQIANHSFTFRSRFADGTLAHEIQTCDIEGGAPCGIRESRWEPCGNLAYSGNQTGNYRWSSFGDWSWDADGKPLSNHDRWNTVTDFFNSTETYHVDGAGKVVSGTILITNPPSYPLPPTEKHDASYSYDAAGHLVERVLDGKSQWHASFDAAGRVVERTVGNAVARWTYDGCGR